MMYLKKWLKIPGPKELGMSDNNYSMPSSLFRNYPGEVTWEDYYARIKKEFPVRYFISSTVPKFFRRRWMRLCRPVTDAIYWLKCHLLKKHQYHLVDIRQPYNEVSGTSYSHGWIDTDWRMTYALFNLLVEFVEKEMPHGYFVPSEEDAAKDVPGGECNEYTGLKRQLDNHKEYMAIYNFWKTEYPAMQAKYGELLHAWSESRKITEDNSNPETKKLWDEKISFEEMKDKKLEEMLHRLITVRHCLWT